MSKKFKLSREEQDNLINRYNMQQEHQYYIKLIEMDKQGYIQAVVRKRLGLTNGENLKIDEFTGDIEVVEVKPELVTEEKK